MSDFKMEYELSTNFDSELIEGVSRLDKDKQIKTVFGKVRKDLFGGGRSSVTLPDISFEDLEKHVKLCHEKGIKFNYLINPACLGNREVNPVYHKKAVKYLAKLRDIGVDAITVNSPLLCRLIKEQFPEFQITIGVAAGVCNIKTVKYWEEMGADEITFPHSVNRNFKFLEEALKFTKNRHVTLRIIANNICLHECPYKFSHSSAQSHSSQKGNSSSNLYIDYHLLNCNNKKVREPRNLIASEWIRPEDVHIYEEMCDRIGNDKFSIKILDRTKTTDFLLTAVKAYLTQSYDGNLLDIVSWPSLKDTKNVNQKPMYASAIKNRYNIKELLKYKDIFRMPEIYIDNKKLDGFIDRFVKGEYCSNKICSNEATDETSCIYCSEWAKKVVSFKQEEVGEWLDKSDELINSLETSKFFK